MTDSSPPRSAIDQKRALRRGIWLVFGAGMLLVLMVTAIVARSSQAQVGIVNQIMTMVMCFLPTLLVLLVLWLAVAAAMFGVSRLEIKVTSQLAGLEDRAHTAQTRARAAGLTLGKAVSRVVSRTAIIERWFSTFEPKSDQDEANEQ